VNAIKGIYNTGLAEQDMTARLFTWGILSRGAGPAQQEGAFIDILEGATPFIRKAVDGTFTEADLPAWKEMVSANLPEGSPGKQVTMNANAAGKLLVQLGRVSKDTGTTALKQIHDLLADPKASGPQVRRKFFEVTNKAGIDNKVVSFLALVSGKEDVLVMDRIQSRHLWEDGRYENKNIYDGLKKGNGKGGLTNLVAGPRGLMITEMLENGLAKTVTEAYRLIGRPQDASLGRMHWETWLIEGNQPVSHSTLESVRSGSAIGGAVTEGKPGTFSSGVTYRQTVNGPIQEYPLSDGTVVRMTPERQKEFEAFLKNPDNEIVTKEFRVKASKESPWYTRPEIDRRKVDETARRFQNANADGTLQSGAVRPITGGNTVSGRRRSFLNAFRRDRNRSAAVASRRNNGRGVGGTTGPYTRETLKGNVRNGLLSFTADPNTKTLFTSAGLNLPAVNQVDAAANAVAYNADMIRAMKGHTYGAQVDIKSAEDLSQARLFRTEAGSGFAIKPDGDIVAVFASPNELPSSSYSMLMAAVDAGGTKLDAFDTYLPKIYESVGFRPVARLKWNEEFAPLNWNKNDFKEHNNGEPDIVYFVHDPEYYGGAKNVPVVTDYKDAKRLQDKALGISNVPAAMPAQQALPKVDPSLPKYEGMRDATVQHLKNKGIMSDEEYRVAELDGYVEDPKFTYSIDDSGSNSSYITLKKTTDYDEKYGVLDSDEYTIRFSDHSLPKQYAYDQNIYNVSEDYYDETINGKTLNDAIDYVDSLLPPPKPIKKANGGSVERVYNDRRYI
jgi:hypothetical protein